MLGKRVGAYRLVSELGSGALGSVYVAEDRDGASVAVKLVHSGLLAEPGLLKRFLLEARIVGRLSHQNLIQVYDVGRDHGTLYFSMEYVDGTTVEKIIDRDGAMPLDMALEIATQILRAITYI